MRQAGYPETWRHIMAQKKFKCTKCKRSFSMPAHLARHLSSTHASKKAKAAAKRKRARATAKKKAKVTRTQVGRGKAAPVFGKVSARLVKEMQRCHAALAREHAALQAKLVAIEEAIEAMGAARLR